ncbi:RNA polymerase sigma factor [Leifsonia aquatica]|uniref:RNA polymerase sigma factor, sigma-70 family n=2 Tax=Leifsonia aquatica TaxID=144185 RepID=U2TFU9_LEIAQ|nr:sigma-70 family RNA polymerase sigma factor [Leifsonia aquatica]ERK73567.1 RNA polymerase sigma factor, sigma-70 family [Leifsonia aquatica ATCC 14665]MBB2968016.1 RNA polymerase sigma-70 factor (ECF subfamily) [Leifsonia aquatica]
MTVSIGAERTNDNALEPFLREIAPDLLAYFTRRVWPTEDAADCLSETLLVLWRRREDLPANEQDHRAWAFGVARRVLANFRRGAIRRIALTDRLRESLSTSAVATGTDETITDALAQLNENDRELVTLILWDGFGVAEAGAVLGLKPATARTRFARAKARLRQLLG